MKGLIVFYMNFVPEHGQNQMEQIEIMMKINHDIFEKMRSAGDYYPTIVPCAKEACRVEKVDFDKPFPRYVSKTHVDIDSDEKRAEKRLDKEKTAIKVTE